MSRATIAKLWLIGFFVPIVGMILLLEGLANAIGVLALVGWVATIAGGLAQLCAWILALGYTARHAHWRWFTALLVLSTFCSRSLWLDAIHVSRPVMIVFLLSTPKDELAGRALPVRA